MRSEQLRLQQEETAAALSADMLQRERMRVPYQKLLRDGPPLRCDNAGGDDGKIEPSNAFAYLFVGLHAGDPEEQATLEAALMRHNLWAGSTWDHEIATAMPRDIPSAAEHPMFLFISSPSAKVCSRLHVHVYWGFGCYAGKVLYLDG